MSTRDEPANEKRGRSEPIDISPTRFEWTDDDGFVVFETPDNLEACHSRPEPSPQQCVDGSTKAIFQSGTSKIIASPMS